MSAPNSDSLLSEKLFRGNIFIFQAFDVGDDINLEKLKLSGDIIPKIVNAFKIFSKTTTRHLQLNCLKKQKISRLNS